MCLGIPICGIAAEQMRKKDPGAVVWDEFASLPMVFFGVSPELLMQPMVLGCGFLLHRIFDISKLPPARQLERLPGGLGIMADDWCASHYAWVALKILLDTEWIPFTTFS